MQVRRRDITANNGDYASTQTIEWNADCIRAGICLFFKKGCWAGIQFGFDKIVIVLVTIVIVGIDIEI